MCRLLGLVHATPRTVTEAVGEATVQDFFSLARIHADGWGIARVLLPGEPPAVRVSSADATTDPELATEVTTAAAAATIVHLRWATSGLAVRPENSHPFVHGQVAFAHNGSVQPTSAMDGLLDDRSRTELRGTTDSERYFAVVRQHLRTVPDLTTATVDAVRELRDLYPDASLNALLVDGDCMVAVHASATSRLPAEDLDDIGRAGLPEEHLENYFGLRLARPDDGTVVIGSTGFAGPAWEPLPPESVTRVDLRDRSVHTTLLSGTAGTGRGGRLAG